MDIDKEEGLLDPNQVEPEYKKDVDDGSSSDESFNGDSDENDPDIKNGLVPQLAKILELRDNPYHKLVGLRAID